jgi:hypothetical protein
MMRQFLQRAPKYQSTTAFTVFDATEHCFGDGRIVLVSFGAYLVTSNMFAKVDSYVLVVLGVL